MCVISLVCALAPSTSLDVKQHRKTRSSAWEDLRRKSAHLILTLLCSLTIGGTVVAQAPAAGPTAEEKVTDTKQMQQIWKALMAYTAEKGATPDFLSDLVPAYLPEKEILVSPVDRRKGKADKISEEDPKLPCSYRYTFGAKLFGSGNDSSRYVKKLQMQEFGPVVPILRCFHYPRVLNIAYSGDVYETDQNWEGAPETKTLIEKLGLGEGFKEGEFATLTVLDKTNGEPIEGAEVRLTDRRYHSLPLPDRTIKTNTKGEAQIPLGPRQPRTRRLTVTVVKPGLTANPETWTEGSMFLQRSISLIPSVQIGGVLKRDDGALLSEAQVMVHLVGAGTVGARNERLFTTVRTDTNGQWRCEVPKTFTRLALHVSHPSTQIGKYICTEEGGEGTLSRDALLAQTAELKISAVNVISGTITDSQGAPIADAEIFILPRTLRPSTAPKTGPQAEEPLNLPLKTDLTGAFSLPWKHTEDVILTVFSGNYAPAQQTVTVSAAIQPMKMTLSEGRKISGRVVDTSARPLPDAAVHLFTLGENGVPLRKKVATTDTDGNFTWEKAPRHRVALIILKDGYSGAIKDFGFTVTQPAVITMGKADPSETGK